MPNLHKLIEIVAIIKSVILDKYRHGSDNRVDLCNLKPPKDSRCLKWLMFFYGIS